MQNDPRWVAVTECFKEDSVDAGSIASQIADGDDDRFELFQQYQNNLEELRNIVSEEFPIMQVDDDSTLQQALTVFDRVNSQGIPLSDADIALAHMVSSWPETRRKFKKKLAELEDAGFNFISRFWYGQ